MIELMLTVTAVVTCIYLIVTVIEFLKGFKQIKNLIDQIVLPRDQLPSISIVFSALNEQHDIKAALTSMLKLDYPRLEIIAINDRSTDQTPAILDELAAQYPELHIRHISELPNGWFGKNHALQIGAEMAAG